MHPLLLIASLGAPIFAPLAFAVDPLTFHHIEADGIKASFIPYGARLTSLLVPDRDGKEQDVIVGFDDPQLYIDDVVKENNYFGPVVGRYANRISNGTFELGGKTYHTPKNEDGERTLHGGDVGYDQRNWTVASHSSNSITFSLVDPGWEGFPGTVITHATFSVNSTKVPGCKVPRTQLNTRTVSVAVDHETPIMLSNHLHWNLNAFKAQNILKDTTIEMPLTPRFLKSDGVLIPTGEIGDVVKEYNGALDFQQPKLAGENFKNAEEVCGSNCTGWDNCLLVDRPTNEPDWTSSPDTMTPHLRLSSSITGISLEISSNQRAFQIYSCARFDGTVPVRESQVKRNKDDPNAPDPADKVKPQACFVVEPEGWIDAINNPKWGQGSYQIYSPKTGPAVNWAKYVFDAK